jgi:phosphate transport system permease protein
MGANMTKFKTWWQSGSPFIWLNAGAVSASIIVVFGLLLLIAMRGMGHFWPANIAQISYQDETGVQRIIGERVTTESVSRIRYEESGGKAPEGAREVERLLVKTGNREILGADFRWLNVHDIQKTEVPNNLAVIERVEWGNFYGYLKQVSEQQQVVATGDAAWAELQKRLDRVRDLREEIHALEKDDIGAINYRLEKLRLERKKLALKGQDTEANLAVIASEEAELNKKYQGLRQQLSALFEQINRDHASFEVMGGQQIDMPLAKMVSVLQPNSMSVFDKSLQYMHNFKNFMLDDPREANTEGGVFPAIFGTVMMVILMSILVTPLGVIAALYLREYARQGAMIRIIRIAVNNLAGVPSIVYGVFGLGFFVYFLGGSIDKLFFPEVAPSPVFGTPGLIWASLTLSLLTLPVVIVSTEEGLARIPSALREGSLALGATKFETIWKVVLPMASPAIMTGLILAIARAAGEVAPLMLVGVVKLAPELPLDENSPFIHLERKFMHLGFHIYDVGFQSPNIEAARPLVYATAFLLVLVIVLLNISAIMMRNRLREKFKAFEH